MVLWGWWICNIVLFSCSEFELVWFVLKMSCVVFVWLELMSFVSFKILLWWMLKLMFCMIFLWLRLLILRWVLLSEMLCVGNLFFSVCFIIFLMICFWFMEVILFLFIFLLFWRMSIWLVIESIFFSLWFI